jgi:type I restriction enzyme M protein
MASTETDRDGVTQLDAKELGVDPEELWQAPDKLRGSIDAAEYKHVVLGLIFLKYISDAFEARREELKSERQSLCGNRKARCLR